MKIEHCKVIYKSGYKYQLDQDYFDRLLIKPPKHIECGAIFLGTAGALVIERGYAWDGPSGLTIDTKSSIRASLVHDALYELIRKGYLDESYREAADYEFHERCIEDRMLRIRAYLWYRAVRIGAGPAADPRNRKKAKVAP